MLYVAMACCCCWVSHTQIKDSQRLQGVCRDLAFSNLEYEAEERPALRPGHPEYDPVER
jgi:predicted GNAT family acetyltransferase